MLFYNNFEGIFSRYCKYKTEMCTFYAALLSFWTFQTKNKKTFLLYIYYNVPIHCKMKLQLVLFQN